MQPEFTPQELQEIKKWANVIGYQGTAADLRPALELNRAIVTKIEARLSEKKPHGKNYMKDTAEVDA